MPTGEIHGATTLPLLSKSGWVNLGATIGSQAIFPSSVKRAAEKVTVITEDCGIATFLI